MAEYEISIEKYNPVIIPTRKIDLYRIYTFDDTREKYANGIEITQTLLTLKEQPDIEIIANEEYFKIKMQDKKQLTLNRLYKIIAVKKDLITAVSNFNNEEIYKYITLMDENDAFINKKSASYETDHKEIADKIMKAIADELVFNPVLKPNKRQIDEFLRLKRGL